MKAVFGKICAHELCMSEDMCMCCCARFSEFTLSCVTA